ncbi:MAG: hypothetical protein WD048_00895 [Chitinophagales bacterium]
MYRRKDLQLKLNRRIYNSYTNIKLLKRKQENIDESFTQNQLKITSFLNKMINKGYEVKSSSALGTANFIIFRKKDVD